MKGEWVRGHPYQQKQPEVENNWYLADACFAASGRRFLAQLGVGEGSTQLHYIAATANAPCKSKHYDGQSHTAAMNAQSVSLSRVSKLADW